MEVGSAPFSKWSQVRAEALSSLVHMGCAVKHTDTRIQVEDRVTSTSAEAASPVPVMKYSRPRAVAGGRMRWWLNGSSGGYRR